MRFKIHSEGQRLQKIMKELSKEYLSIGIHGEGSSVHPTQHFITTNGELCGEPDWGKVSLLTSNSEQLSKNLQPYEYKCYTSSDHKALVDLTFIQYLTEYKPEFSFEVKELMGYLRWFEMFPFIEIDSTLDLFMQLTGVIRLVGASKQNAELNIHSYYSLTRPQAILLREHIEAYEISDDKIFVDDYSEEGNIRKQLGLFHSNLSHNTSVHFE